MPVHHWDRADAGVAVAEARPKVRRKVVLSTTTRSRRKTQAVRHVGGHRIVAVVESMSPANKDRREHVEAFLDKAESILNHGVHVLVVDLFAPGPHDPQGIHGAVWERLGERAEGPPCEEPFTLVPYAADSVVKAYSEHLAVGRESLEPAAAGSDGWRARWNDRGYGKTGIPFGGV